MNQISELHGHEDHELARNAAIEALNLSKEHDYNYGVAYSLSSLGKIYMNQASYDTAQYLFEQCLILDSIMNDPEGFLVDYGNMALVHKRQGNYQLSVEYDLKALKTSEENGYLLYSAYIYNNLGNSYKYLEDPVKALESYQKAMDIWLVQEEEQENLGVVFMNISIIYSENPELIPEDDPNVVFRSLDKADEYFIHTDDQFRLSDTRIHRASILIQENRAGEALELAIESEMFYEESGEIFKLCNAKNYVAHSLSALGKHTQAIEKIEESFTLIKKHEMGGEIKLESLFSKSEFLRRTGQFEKSNEVLNQAYQYKDSLMGNDLKSRINEIQAQYDLSQERANVLELEKLNQEREFESAELRSWIIIIVLFALLLFLMILALVRYKLNKSKLQLSEYQNKLLDEKQQISALNLRLLASQMNPHFTKNAVNAIKSLIEKNDLEKSNEYLSAFGRLQKNILENASDNTIYLSDELDLIEDYIKLEQLRQDEAFEYQLEVDDELDREYDRIPSMMLQPVIENAIVHGLFHRESGGLLKVAIRKVSNRESEGVECIIEDNGPGRAFSTKLTRGRKGMGLQVIEKRLAILSQSTDLDCRIRITDQYDGAQNPTGTSVQLVLPLL